MSVRLGAARGGSARRRAHRAAASRRHVQRGLLCRGDGGAGPRGDAAGRRDAARPGRRAAARTTTASRTTRGSRPSWRREVGADVVVGFSMGASVALEMVASGAFTGPAVLLGISLSADGRARVLPRDRPARQRAGQPARRRPGQGSGLDGQARPGVRRAPGRAARRLPQERSRGTCGRACASTCAGCIAHERPPSGCAERGVPTWVVHAEKGDGGLTDDERRTLERVSARTSGDHPGQRVLPAQRGAGADRRRHRRGDRGGGRAPRLTSARTKRAP